MGGKNSKEVEDDEERGSVCNFPNPFCVKNKTNKVFKPFGTPQSTPRPTRPPIYGGLEAEPSSRSIGDLMELYKKSAVIHDGENGELELYEKYDLLEVLGVGSTSTCNRCVNRKTGKSYACKIIDKSHIEQQFKHMMDQFETEIDALRSLHHPHIISLLDVYVTKDKIYIIMELMEGGELFDYVVKKGTLNEEEAAKIVHMVTSALVYMHDKNIVHRDLKPENLLLVRKPKSNDDIDVKIIDFGLSKFMSEPVARSFLGTRGYLAPEMLQRRGYSKSVDTWALGIIVYVLLCGCLPFDDGIDMIPATENDILYLEKKFVLRFPRWARNISPSAKDLLGRLLDVNPLRRFTAEQALNHPWVRGQTALRSSMLQSPKQLRLTPNDSRFNNGTGMGTNGHQNQQPQNQQKLIHPNHRTRNPHKSPNIHNRRQKNQPQRQFVRKQSI